MVPIEKDPVLAHIFVLRERQIGKHSVPPYRRMTNCDEPWAEQHT